jgi:hypothetical protein
VGIAILTALFGFLFRIFYKNISLKTALGLTFLGVGLHVLYDLTNSYGVVLFYPLSKTRYELGWLFIIDLAMWLLLLTPLVLALLPARWRNTRGWSQGALVGVIIYAIFCGLSRFRSQKILQARIKKENLTPSFSYVFPEALGPHRFRGVVKIGDQYRMWLLHVFSGKTELVGVYQTQAEEPAARAARQSDMGKKIEWFFKAPVWMCASGNPAAESIWNVSDLRFHSVVLGRRIPFVYQFSVSKEGVHYLGRASSLFNPNRMALSSSVEKEAEGSNLKR